MSTRITPCLWFNFNAEEAVGFYIAVFNGGRILDVSHYGDAMPGLSGKVLMIRFEIEGQELQALNGGPQFPFTEAVSLSVECEGQGQVDHLWAKLTADGGSEGQCGWLKDRFGLSWQIVPRPLVAMLKDPDAAKAARAMGAMLSMRKIDIARVQQAFDRIPSLHDVRGC